MGFLGIYGIGCLVVLIVIVMYLLNEYFHHHDIELDCIVSCFFLIAMSWASGLVVIWCLAMKVLEFFNIDDTVVIKGKKSKR